MHAAEVDIVFTATTHILATHIAALTRCQLIVIYGGATWPGAPRVDLEAARAAGIYVASAPDYAPELWAERIWKYIAEARTRLENASPVKRPARLGIVGVGSVGKTLARRAHAAKLAAQGYDPFVDDSTFASFALSRAPLAELLGSSSIVVVTLPNNTATRAMIGTNEMQLLTPDASLIVACDPLVFNENALKTLNEKHHVVWPGESPLNKMPSPLSQSHYAPELITAIATDPAEVRRAATEVAAQLLAGNRPPHLLIDPPCPRHALWISGAL